MTFQATLIFMVDLLSPIYYELHRLQIHEFELTAIFTGKIRRMENKMRIFFQNQNDPDKFLAYFLLFFSLLNLLKKKSLVRKKLARKVFDISSSKIF